jgi:hypothetical protein
MTYHLRFRDTCRVDLQIRGKPRLERVKIRSGEVIEAHVRPFVQETDNGPIEMADLFLGAEGVLRGVPMACFQFE